MRRPVEIRADDVPPVSTYEAARSWLWARSSPESWLFPEGRFVLPLEAQLVCDIFRVTPGNLVQDLRCDWRQALASTRHCGCGCCCKAGDV